SQLPSSEGRERNSRGQTRRQISRAGKSLSQRAGHLHHRAVVKAQRKGAVISGHRDLHSMRMKLSTQDLQRPVCRVVVLALGIAILAQAAVCQPRVRETTHLATQVRTEFLHAWHGYKKYAWGHDDLKPLSKTYHDWYCEPLLMTPVDALDTMILMGPND